jgi:uncharacterized membrane protein
MENRHFEFGKGRIEALNDGLFAIAMTILVLEFKVPNLPHNAPNVQVIPALLKLWPEFLAYAVSFISLGVYWIGHHHMYHCIRRVDRVMLWLNIFFFMFVSFLPFATSILNAFKEAQIAPVLFGANISIIGWILYLQWIYAGSRRDMLAPFVTPRYRDVVHRRMLVVPAITTGTMLICFWSSELSLAIYLLALPLYMLPGKLDSPQEVRLEQDSPQKAEENRLDKQANPVGDVE